MPFLRTIMQQASRNIFKNKLKNNGGMGGTPAVSIGGDGGFGTVRVVNI